MVLKIIVLIEIFVRVLTILAQMKKRTPIMKKKSVMFLMQYSVTGFEKS